MKTTVEFLDGLTLNEVFILIGVSIVIGVMAHFAYEYLCGVYRRVKQKRSEQLGREIMSQPEFSHGDLVHYEFGKGRVIRGFVVETSNVKRKAIIEVESGSLIEASYNKLSKI